MNEEQKQYVSLHLGILKKVLKDEGLCFAFLIDKTDFNKSYLAIADVQSIRNGKVDGMKISLENLNDGLIYSEDVLPGESKIFSGGRNENLYM